VQQILVDEDNLPLAMGRAKRRFTSDQYRAMVVRDFGCRGPDCDVSPDGCESHHLDEWVADQGPTDLSNGALFCRGHCHRQLHEGDWTVNGDTNGRLDFYDPNDNHLGHTEPRIPPEAIPTRQGRQRTLEDHAINERVAALSRVAAR
jgi:hypothetical protein